jgi:hypothetical protein
MRCSEGGKKEKEKETKTALEEEGGLLDKVVGVGVLGVNSMLLHQVFLDTWTRPHDGG